jgi:gluconolactonase
VNDVKLVAEGLQFPEGPIAMPDGSVILVEIKRGTLSRVTPDGAIEVVAECGGGPNGAAIGPDGAVYVCNNGGFEWAEPIPGLTLPGHQPEDYIGGRIQRVDLESGKVDDLYTECNGFPLRGPNDLVFDTSGNMWFTDHGKTRPRDKDQGGVYYASPDGTMIREVIYPSDAPNGIGLSPDGTRLYYAETHTGRVWQRSTVAPGELAPSNAADQSALLVGLPGLNLLDSLAIDGDGHVCVGTLANGGITDIAPDGTFEHYPVPQEYWDPLVTNICFGGPDLQTAYLTLSGFGRLISVRWPRPGLKLNY